MLCMRRSLQPRSRSTGLPGFLPDGLQGGFSRGNVLMDLLQRPGELQDFVAAPSVRTFALFGELAENLLASQPGLLQTGADFFKTLLPVGHGVPLGIDGNRAVRGL